MSESDYLEDSSKLVNNIALAGKLDGSILNPPITTELFSELGIKSEKEL